MASPLRVGVLLESAVVPAWQYRLLADLACSGSAELAVVGWLRTPPQRAGGLVFRGYERIDRALFRSPQDPLARVDASGLLAAAAQLEVVPIRRGDGLALAASDVEALRGRRLDALLQLSGDALAADGDVARLGILGFAHDAATQRGIPPFFAEVTSGARVTETRLVARTSTRERVLYRSYGSTNPNSLDRNRSGALWKAAALPDRAWRAFVEGREPPFDGGPTCDDAGAPARRPSSLAVARFTGSTVARVARNRARMRRKDRVWFVAIRRRGAAPILEDPLAGFTPLPCPPDRFHADPILVYAEGRHHLFFEDADRASGRGAISCCEVGADGSPGPLRRILEAETHFSYPCVFAWRGAHYMIPETSERRTIELYRATEFPLRWQLEKVLFHDVAAVDATPFVHRDRLWLFVAMSPTGASLNDELYLFHAADPTGEWIPHPMNPIVSDVRRARPAGPLFVEGDTLYRPGQDCAGDYGAAFWLSRVDVLDERSYRETALRRVGPGWHPGGVCTHTYTRAGQLEAMDNRIWAPRESTAR